MLFMKVKGTTLSIYQVDQLTIDGKQLEDYNPKKGKFGDTVIELHSGEHTFSGIFIMTKGNDNQLTNEMKFNATLKEGKNILSVSSKEKHFKQNLAFPIAKKFDHNGEQLQFYVGILK
jgi:hypothetical protein